MVNLDFELQDQANNYEVHSLDKNVVLVAWNGYSYTRIIWPKDEVAKLINKLQEKQNDETESI
jgi:hypothetical protein